MSGKWQALLVSVGGLAAVIFAPVTVLAVTVYTLAWSRGWSPTRVRFLVPAAWVFPVVLWVGGGVGLGESYHQAWALVEARDWMRAWIPLLPWMVPAGITTGSILWALRWRSAQVGLFKNPRVAGIWEARQWKHAMRRARSEAKKPGLVPLTTRGGGIVLGRAAVINESGAGKLAPHDPRQLVIEFDRVGKHLAIAGEPGAGKTEVLFRVQAGWGEVAWTRYVLGTESKRPLIIQIECKGGRDAEKNAARWVEHMEALGLARHRIGVFPFETRLDLWTLPAGRLVEVLVEMLRTDNPFYEGMQDALVALAVLAPAGPPRSSVDFIRRLSTTWLTEQYQERAGELESIKLNGQHFAGIAERYRGLFRRIGVQLDSGRSLDDFDALSVTLPGTANAMTAAAQAQAVLELVTELAANGDPARLILLVFDEFSAVAERVSVTEMMERFRSLGCAVIPAGQSWASFGPTEDARHRLFAAAGGGFILMSTTHVEPFSKLAGSRTVIETGVKKIGDGDWGDEGTGRAQQQFLVHPDLVREMGRQPGAAVYVHHGTATWGVVTPVEVSEQAPALMPYNPLRKAVERLSRAAVTRGDRISRRELDAGLEALGVQAARPGPAGPMSAPAGGQMPEPPGGRRDAQEQGR